MNDRLLKKAIEVSRALKPLRGTGLSFHVSLAFYKRDLIGVGWNDYNVPHNKFVYGQYHNHASLPGEYRVSRHSECHLHSRLGEDNWRKYEVVNVRLNNQGEPRISKPCPNCLRAVVEPMRPKKFFYSDSDGQFQELILN